jgi:hypothetical protein
LERPVESIRDFQVPQPAERQRIGNQIKAAMIGLAIDWLLRSDIGEVLKKIVDSEKFPDHAIGEKRT